MAIDTKHEDLQNLRIDRSQRGDHSGEPPAWARRYIIGGIALVVVLGLFTLAYRAFSSDTPLVEVVQLRGKRHVRQQVTESAQRVHNGEERKHEPQEFGQEFHLRLFCHGSSRCVLPNGFGNRQQKINRNWN